MIPPPRAFRFGEYTLEPENHRLRRGSDEVIVRPKVFDTLLYLVQRHGRAVAKGELLDAVWPGTFVADAVLTHCIAEIRQALRDDARAPRYVKTLSKVGYVFIGDVESVGGEAPGEASRSPFLRTLADVQPSSFIAVLPFANLSAEPENEYFCDGLSEELINGLTKVPTLHVVAHTSSFSFKGRNLDARDIGRQLGVGSILEGSVRKSGDRVRISAQLIDAASGHHRWCEQYDRRLDDVFAVQDDISRAVLSALEQEFREPGARALVRPSTRSMEAYLLYLQGRAAWHRRFAGEMQNAMSCFQRAIETDPGFALAYTGLADALGALGVWGFAPPRDVFPRAAALARQALALDPGLAEAHASHAFVHMFYDWDWASTERALARALALNPGVALTHVWAGHFLSMVGRFDEALLEMEHGHALDPLSPITGANVGWTYHLAGRQDKAEAVLDSVLAREPANGMALFYAGFVLAAVGRHGEALRSLQRAVEATGGMPFAAESLGWVLALQGHAREARQILADTLDRAAKAYVPTSAIAMLHLGLAEDDAMFACLDRCVEERDALLPWLKFMPAFDRVRRDPRFRTVLAKIGLA